MPTISIVESDIESNRGDMEISAIMHTPIPYFAANNFSHQNRISDAQQNISSVSTTPVMDDYEIPCRSTPIPKRTTSKVTIYIILGILSITAIVGLALSANVMGSLESLRENDQRLKTAILKLAENFGAKLVDQLNKRVQIAVDDISSILDPVDY